MSYKAMKYKDGKTGKHGCKFVVLTPNGYAYKYCQTKEEAIRIARMKNGK